jgi:hypothetical protein
MKELIRFKYVTAAEFSGNFRVTVSKMLENHPIVASPIAREDFVAETFCVSKTFLGT